MLPDRLQAIRSIDICMKLIKNADHVLLQFTDLLGMLKGRTIPAEEARNALREGVTFDGSSIKGGVTIEQSDMIMKPDPETFTAYPHYFYEKNVANFLCNLYTPDCERFEGDPRYVCQKAVNKALVEGYEPTAAAELEFYLVKKNAQDELQPVENHLIDNQRYFDNIPGRDITESFRMDLSNALSTMGITVERQHHEVGSAQNEITFKYSDPLATADSIVRYKFAARAVADRKYGWIATFMPKPWHGRPGSGMHIHLGLRNTRTGKNPFYDPEGYAHISQLCRCFIGGILEHANALSAVVAPTVNSYKRLIRGFEAPLYVAWSRENRSALIRIPAFLGENEREARIEFRCPDPLCNPYFAFAVTLEAGLDGIRRKIDPGEPLVSNAYHLTETERKRLGIKTLPACLGEAFEEWGSDDICYRAMGKTNAEKFMEAKSEEWREYQKHMPNNDIEVTSWEVDKYLYS